ncbi:MAG TPA: AAA family ATPase [Rhodopila sp.]|uniref:AAA family ATPase n=1 Tax=Rhodopila sp. TaxID=2480087 RepID=UPI002B5EA877|nr:AAA family ATPase [Rhodopila sp.]HVY15782.1 AAA family ATPase [Rhodopila sp.]
MAPIRILSIAGYRSLRDVRLELDALTVITGANGSGKSSLYRGLRLLADIAQGRVIQSLAQEGGLPSALWAGPETISAAVRRGLLPVQGTTRKHPVSVRLGFASESYGYAIDLGLPQPPAGRFLKDPVIKAESLWTGLALRPSSVFAERRGPSVRVRDRAGAWQQAAVNLATYDSMLTYCADPRDGGDLLAMREAMRAWRFYDHLRTDAQAPARRAQVGTHTAVLAGDGADLAAAIATIQEIGAHEALDAAIADAFPGATIGVSDTDGYFEVEMRQHGLLRPLKAAELSDGTLRYLLLAAALLTPRPPPLMVLNEPETSLHPDLLEPLARLIARASDKSQVIVVSHAERLVRALRHGGARSIVLVKELGETRTDGEAPIAWTWPTR